MLFYLTVVLHTTVLCLTVVGQVTNIKTEVLEQLMEETAITACYHSLCLSVQPSACLCVCVCCVMYAKYLCTCACALYVCSVEPGYIQ